MSKSIKNCTNVLVENQRLFNNIIEDKWDESIELVSEIVPKLLAHKLVSVQPRLSPNAILYYIENGIIKSQPNVSRTRQLKIVPTVENVVDELDKELILDLLKNCGTCLSISKDTIGPSISTAFILIKTKNVDSEDFWAVVSNKTYEQYKQKIEERSNSVYINENVPDNTILLGGRRNIGAGNAYIYSPYILLDKKQDKILTTYGKLLMKGKDTAYAKLTIKDEFDFSKLKVMVL